MVHPGKTIITPYYYNSSSLGLKFIAENGNEIRLGSDMKFWISAVAPTFMYDQLIMKQGSKFIFDANSKLFTYNGGKYIDEGSTLTFTSGNLMKAFASSEIAFTGTTHTLNNGLNLEIDANAILSLGNNTTLILDGTNTKLKLSPNAVVSLGENSKIVIKNGANIDAQNIVFGITNNQNWQGIVLENAGSGCIIKNCTFNKAVEPIKIINNSSAAHLEKRIENNTFNLTAPNSKCIYAENVFNILIQYNTFYISSGSTGVHIKNIYNPETEEVPAIGGAPSYNLGIVKNTFYNGNVQINVDCSAGALTPIYIYSNYFNSDGGTTFGIFAKKIYGYVKSNRFNSFNIGNTIGVMQSDISLYGSTPMRANNRNLILSAQSYASLGPQPREGNTLFYSGGYNAFNSSNGDNILITGGSYQIPYMNYGKNCFTAPNSSQKYHIFGSGLDPNYPSIFQAKNNFWNFTPPHYSLQKAAPDNWYITLNYSPTIANCVLFNEAQYLGHELVDMGFGIMDTVWYGNADSNLTVSQDELLNTEAEEFKAVTDFPNAILEFKNLIQDYPESPYSSSCLYSLYDCYVQLDTSADQTYNDNLYSDIKNFLNDEILSGEHSAEFEDVAYNIILMAEVNMKNYNDALSGYEFLSQYHPDPEMRLLASYDYNEVAEIMGWGEGSNENTLDFDKEISKRKQRSLKFANGDPLTQRLKNSYDKEIDEKAEKKSNATKSALKTKTSFEKENLAFNEKELKMTRRANEVLISGRNKSKETKEKEFMKDAFMIMDTEENTSYNVENITPQNFKLHQNYPNPFNPSTTIKYEIPQDGLVQIKIYDIIGREVMTLVNEQKTAGTYETVFNASNFASGIYFYKIQSGNFVETKRMMLVK